jgi:hypothetical protein
VAVVDRSLQPEPGDDIVIKLKGGHVVGGELIKQNARFGLPPAGVAFAQMMQIEAFCTFRHSLFSFGAVIILSNAPPKSVP